METRKGFDIAVVGCGPSGLMAAIHAAKGGARVVAIDSQQQGGKKILLSGGGRCNILPMASDPAVFATSSSEHTLRKILRSWPLEEVRAFLEGKIGIKLVEQKKAGKVFPATGGGEAVFRSLRKEAKRAGVEYKVNARVIGVHPDERRRIEIENGDGIVAQQVILATGGLSYPQTGSDGTGLEIAERLGHEIEAPYPALTTVHGGTRPHHRLSGLALPARLTIGEGKGCIVESGDFLFTHFGYSGPLVLNLAHHLSQPQLRGGHPRVTVSWMDQTQDDWLPRLSPSSKTVRGVLKEVLPDRLVDVLLKELELSDAKTSTLVREDRDRLIESLVAYPLVWSRCGGFGEAEVTGGGVRLDQVDPVTLRSRDVSCLHFCGEMLDAFGPIGGHNFLWAFVTGKLAGVGARESLS